MARQDAALSDIALVRRAGLVESLSESLLESLSPRGVKQHTL
jgi:hypothetical protein